MTDEPELLRLAELDRTLRGIAFAPRASLGPELLGRLRRGERSKGAGLAAASPSGPRQAWHGGPGRWRRARFLRCVPRGRSTVDRCCYDLDGGGDADDGVLILAERDAKVHQLTRLRGSRPLAQLHRQRSRPARPRATSPAMHEASLPRDSSPSSTAASTSTAAGPDDDGLLVIGVPPDRVVMAAIYERRARPDGRRTSATVFPLR